MGRSPHTITVIDGKSVTTDHPVAFVSGLFRGSQLNLAALIKEAYAIYMSVKKSSFYLIQADVLLKSDHLPLKRFLHKNTLNSKVNNWAMELESFNIQFKHIKGQNNILADILSHLIDIDPDPHRFLKACIAKHINHRLEWDELTPMATACYNFFSNCSARESAFFIMFGRDPIYMQQECISMMTMVYPT